MAAPVNSKVKAGSLGAAVAGVADWILARYLFPHLDDPTAQALILAAVPSALAFAAGYLKKSQFVPLPPGTVISSAGMAVPPPAAPSNVTITGSPPKAAP